MADARTQSLKLPGTMTGIGRGVHGGDGAVAIPPRQRPYDQALQRGFEELRSGSSQPDRLAALGATREGGVIRIPVLNRALVVDLDQRTVMVEWDGSSKSVWAVLAVHYLCATDVTVDDRDVSFSYFSDCRSYLSVFGKRIVGRFLATSGRTAEQFIRASEALGGVRLPGSGMRYSFNVLPRIPVVIVRYDGDDELKAGASVVYRADAERLLPAEDRVVAVELLLDALSNKPMTENGGSHG